jgi:hypothetical protein
LVTSATIAWTTDEPATSQVTYGISPTLTLPTTETTEYVSAHSVVLTHLISNTTYVYRVHSRDSVGNLAISDERSFTTLSSEDIKRVFLPIILRLSLVLTIGGKDS